MKTFHLWLGVLLFCSIIGCKKEKPAPPATLETTVYGRVVLRGTELKTTNKPCTIRAYREYYTSWVDKEKKLMGETQTDTNGYYKLSFKADNLEKFEYHIELQTDIENHFSPKAGKHQIQPGQKQELQLTYTAYAWIRLHTKNINPHVNDKLTISLGGGERYDIWGPVERQNIFLRAGNVNNEISCWLTRQDTTYNLTFNILLPAFDTTYYYLEY